MEDKRNGRFAWYTPHLFPAGPAAYNGGDPAALRYNRASLDGGGRVEVPTAVTVDVDGQGWPCGHWPLLVRQSFHLVAG